MRTRAFTLVELVVVVAIIGVLAAMIAPALVAAMGMAHQTACAWNLKQIGLAVQLYLNDNDGWFFPLYDPPESGAPGRVWYYGFEPNGSPGLGEGNRILDRTQGKLYPYLRTAGSVECPSVPFAGPYKPKYQGEPWTYGINRYLSTHPSPAGGNVRGNGSRNAGSILGRDTSRTVVFADAAQVVTHLAPATASNPMIEDFPYIEPGRPYVQFRHGGQANVLFADWHVEAVPPDKATIDPRLPEAMIGDFDTDDVLYEPCVGR